MHGTFLLTIVQTIQTKGIKHECEREAKSLLQRQGGGWGQWENWDTDGRKCALLEGGVQFKIETQSWNSML